MPNVKKHEKPAFVGISIEENLRDLAKERAREHNIKGKLSPYISDLIKDDLGKAATPSKDRVLRECLDYLRGKGKAGRMTMIRKVKSVLTPFGG